MRLCQSYHPRIDDAVLQDNLTALMRESQQRIDVLRTAFGPEAPEHPDPMMLALGARLALTEAMPEGERDSWLADQLCQLLALRGEAMRSLHTRLRQQGRDPLARMIEGLRDQLLLRQERLRPLISSTRGTHSRDVGDGLEPAERPGDRQQSAMFSL